MRTFYTACYSFSLALLLIIALNIKESTAQQAQLDIELQINESVANSQVVNLTRFLLGNRGGGPAFFNAFIRNEDPSKPAAELYLDLKFRSNKRGLLLDLYQESQQPFSLNAAQQIVTTNNFVTNGLPGVEEDINFEGGLTADGKRFINDVGGFNKLPQDRYTIQLQIFQNGNSKNGGVLLASAEAVFGESIVEEVRDIFLTSPGDALGNEIAIINPYPEFRWEGRINTQYRLIVVEGNGQDSPESLIQSSLSTEPFIVNGASGMGSLLSYEILDVRLKGTSFQFPPSGVQKLQGQKPYYWQVFAELSSGGDTTIRSSEIWSFILQGQGTGLTISTGGELGAILKVLLQAGQPEKLQDGGFKLGSIVIDNQTISGTAMLQRLAEFQNKVNNGEISIINN